MALLTVERSQSLEGLLTSSDESDASVSDERDDDQLEELASEHHSSKHPKIGRLRSPSFAGYFASRGGAVSLPDGNRARTASPLHTQSCGELQQHLQTMVTLLRENDIMKMAVRIESQLPAKKRYLISVTSPEEESLLIGIDWGNGPTVGLVLELKSSTIAKLDGDGGFHVSLSAQMTHCFKPVSVQTLWSAMHVIQRGIDNALRHTLENEGYQDFVSFYQNKITSDPASISEWNMMDNLLSTRQFDLVLSEHEESEQAAVKKLIRPKLKEVMTKVDLDVITSRQIRILCEEELGMDLSEFKSYLDTEMFMILGQMDSASKIFDYLYLGSEWNASDLHELKKLGIGYILNLTKEIDNFFPDTFVYFNVRVYDEEDTELLPHWDHTYKFINTAKLAGSKVLVHCRRGISRSASSVIAYAMKSRNWSLTESMEYVKNCRSIVEPNAGFQKQLIIYEGILNSSMNRYNALFRQRSKSERQLPSAREKRRLFTSTRSDEVAEDQPENKNNNIANENREEIDAVFQSKRPKSWAPESSAVRETTKTLEMPSLLELTERESPSAGKMNQELDGQLEAADDRNFDVEDGEPKQERKKQQRRRIMSRAKTLPCQSPRHWEMSSDDDKSMEEGIAEEQRDEKEEVIIEQAMAASMIKRKLLRSLVQLQEQRGTTSLLDNQFSVESIIRPSSLRRISMSRKLPFERRKSFSEETDASSRYTLRQRAMTIGPTRYHGIDDDLMPEDGNSIEKQENACEGIDNTTQDSNVDTQGNSPQSEEESINLQADGLTDEGTRNVSENNNNSDSLPGCETDQMSKSHNNRSDIPDIPLKNGEDFVIKTSQFKTVKESAKKIEEWQKTRRERFSRKPRRHTVGESEIRKEMEKEASFSGQTRSKSSEGRTKKRDLSSSPVNRVGVDSDSDADPRLGNASSNQDAQDVTDVCTDQSNVAKLEDCRLDNESDRSELVGKPCENPTGLLSDVEGANANGQDSSFGIEKVEMCHVSQVGDAEDLSVRDLVEKHKQLIHKNLSSGQEDTSSSNIATMPSNITTSSALESDVVSYSDEKGADSDDVFEAGKATALGSRHGCDDVDKYKEDLEVASCSKNESYKIETDIVLPGIVKRQSLLLAKAFNYESSPTDPGVLEPADTQNAPESSDELIDAEDKQDEAVFEYKKGPKRNSVKDRLKQLENIQSNSGKPAPNRPVSLHGLDAEVANIMETSASKNSSLSVLSCDIPKSKSAPSSPWLKKRSLSLSEKQHHSSLKDIASPEIITAPQGNDSEVFHSTSLTETQNDIVRGLVDKFEER